MGSKLIEFLEGEERKRKRKTYRVELGNLWEMELGRDTLPPPTQRLVAIILCRFLILSDLLSWYRIMPQTPLQNPPPHSSRANGPPSSCHRTMPQTPLRNPPPHSSRANGPPSSCHRAHALAIKTSLLLCSTTCLADNTLYNFVSVGTKQLDDFSSSLSRHVYTKKLPASFTANFSHLLETRASVGIGNQQVAQHIKKTALEATKESLTHLAAQYQNGRMKPNGRRSL
jgi:hypothetical protein